MALPELHLLSILPAVVLIGAFSFVRISPDLFAPLQKTVSEPQTRYDKFTVLDDGAAGESAALAFALTCQGSF